MAPAPDALRVSVVGGHDRVDLVVPAAVSVAELLPELVRRLGGRDPLAATRGARLSLLGGPVLDAAAGLAAQGVADGAVLTVTDVDDHTRAVDDELAAVVAEAVDRVPRPAPGASRWTGLVIAAALLGLGAIGVLAVRTPAAAAVSGAASVALLAFVAVAGRRARWSAVGAAAGWLAIAHAGAAGLVYGAVGAGVGWVAAGGAAAAVSRRRRSPFWAAVVAGAVLVVAGAVAALSPAPLPVVLACALVLVVVTGDLQPWLAATLAGLVAPPLGEEPPTVPDRDAVADAVRRAHELLVVAAAATGLLLTVLGPVVAGLGPWGVGLALLCCATVALRSRRHRAGTGGLVGVVGASAPLLPVAATAWWHWPVWRLGVAAALVVAGLVVLVAVARPVPSGARAGRAAELLEAVVLVALPPVLLAATGLLDVVRALVG